ncbi:hypothetical protein TSAR_003312 [Trichomalopsis sarcophagae]|uniref:Uncharacterized protein n=1 Tax=Trichomalopsis sarcophagae TaxID=543379 RepID=A0A232F5C8_9HYME|nr:hypothetical protein TSAR_003312 [Trichomalopsis sarcophagae]
MEPVSLDVVKVAQTNSSPKKQEDSSIITTSNWKIANDKSFDDCISTDLLSQAPENTNLEDVVSLDTCIALQSETCEESCKLEFKITNKQKIARIAVVSEASVLEFFKQSGEYTTTSFADFVDEFQDHAVYFAEAKIQPPSTEASIKFTRTKYKGPSMWIYGIKLILTEPISDIPKTTFDLGFTSNGNQQKPEKAEKASGQDLLADINAYMQQCVAMKFRSHTFKDNNKSNEVNRLNRAHINTEYGGHYRYQDPFDLKTYIDTKFDTLEKRLIERIEVMDQKTNQKLDAILKKFEQNIIDKE